jgi:hypothetical protein
MNDLIIRATDLLVEGNVSSFDVVFMLNDIPFS